MSDPLNHESLPDDLFRNRIAAALRELDQPESDADIADAIDAIDAEPIEEAAVQRILGLVGNRISGSLDRRVRPQRVVPEQSRSAKTISSPSHSRGKAKSGGSIVVACLTLTIVVVAVSSQFRNLRFEKSAVRIVPMAKPLPGELIAANREPHVAGSALGTSETAVAERVKPGDTLTTGSREKRRITLPDGSVVSLNEQTKVSILAERRVKVLSGEVFVEVATQTTRTGAVPDQFVVETAQRAVTALGTKFVVKADGKATNVVVTQGKVRVSGIEDVVSSGYELLADQSGMNSVELRPAKRSAYVVDWVKDLISAGTSFVPSSEHAGGTITVVDPQGQEMKLSLRKFHVDVHIEDGFARTTIDQTYFNHTWQQLEGTFRFPFPADASLSRLAMYVNGTLMEGGMVERDYGRNVFEQIRHTRRDPALLEWVDGSTFQMRVFPLEARQEKRILMSYTQRIQEDYGRGVYRFPAGHNLEGVREWSTNVRVIRGAATKWYSPSHVLSRRNDNEDLVIEGREEHAELDRDLIVELGDRTQASPVTGNPIWSTCEQDGFRYLMLRYRPELKAASQRSPRHWVFLVENSADRNDVLAGTQQQIVKTLLENVEHSDTFSLIRAGTQADPFRIKPIPCSLDNIADALQFLREVAPIGALDLEQALQAVRTHSTVSRDVWILHLGTGVPVLGERDPTTLQRLIPDNARYVGVAVGKRWSKSFMQTTATRTGGHVTQINPDEEVVWRAFDLLSTLNAPRLTDIAVNVSEATGASNDGSASKSVAPFADFLLLTNSLAHGQEFAAVARMAIGQSIPKSVTITGKLDRKPYAHTVTVAQTIRSDHVATSEQSRHLPRTWARLEIDRLVSLGAAEHKSQIIELSKSMYVMSPFTSLLVLETEEMYAQFNVDRGRKDHWAMYPAPAQIPVVVDQGGFQSSPLQTAKERLQMAQERAKSAQSNYKRGVADHRPATDLQRLQRMMRAELAEVSRIEREVQRIDQESEAMADPIRRAWESIISRRSLWQFPAANRYDYHNNALPLGWADQQLGWGGGNANLNLNWAKQRAWIIPDTPRILVTDGLDASFSGDQSFIFARDGLHNEQNLDFLFGTRAHFSGGIDSNGDFGEEGVLWSDLEFPVSMSMKQSTTDKVVNYWDAGMSSSGPIRVSPWYSELVEDAYVREERYDKVPILDPISVRLLERTPGSMNINQVSPKSLWVLADLFDGTPSGESMSVGSDDSSEHTFPSLVTASDVISARTSWNLPDPDRIKRYGVDRRQLREMNDMFRPVLDGRIHFVEFDFDNDGDGFRLPVLHEQDFKTQEPAGYLWGSRNSAVSQRGVRYVRHRDVIPLYRSMTVLREMPDYAPGLQTWAADRMAVVEQVASNRPKAGNVDDEARRLIEKARSIGWEKLTRVHVTTQEPSANAETLLIADGTGRFYLDHEVSERLRETVIHDGTHLWHLYPEIGLGAKRTFSRFHQSVIQSLVPWYVPSVDELSVAADVVVKGERTIRITKSPATKSHSPENEKNLAKSRLIGLELVFAADGPLCESRIVDLTSNRVLTRQVIESSGVVRTFDDTDKLMAEAKYERRPVKAPSVVPDMKDLVVLPLPYRSSASEPVTVPVNLQTNAPDYTNLTDDDAMKLLATYFAEWRSEDLINLVQQRFTSRGDRRIGFYVLVASNPYHLARREAPFQNLNTNTPFADFVEQLTEIIAFNSLNHPLEIRETNSPFLQRYCETYRHFSKWLNNTAAARERPHAEVEAELVGTLQFIRECRSLDLAAKLISAVRESLQRNDRTDVAFAKQLNRTTAEIADYRGVPAFGRLSRIEWLLTIGDEQSVAQAKELLSSHLADSAAIHSIPDLNAHTHTAFVKHFKTPAGEPCRDWGDLVKSAALRLLETKHHFTLVEVARRCNVLSERIVANEIFDLAIKDQDLVAKPLLNLMALVYAMEAEQWELAEAFAHRALANERLQKVSQLWRDASQIAYERRKFHDGIEFLDRATELEFEALPKTVDLESFRKDYVTLFNQFDERTKQLIHAGKADQLAFAQRVQRAASRWRQIDVDDAVACHRTAQILEKLGLTAAAWNYWTTPLAETPDQSHVWQTFARAMATENRFTVADQAWSAAFTCEPTNPEILLQHAQFLRTLNKYDRADQLLNQIVTQAWQPRFESVKNSARSLVNGR